MTKKGKKKKHQATAAESTSEDASSKTLQQQSLQQQQQKQEQSLSQVLPGPSQQKVSKDLQQQQQQKVVKSSQSGQQVASSSQKQQSQPQQQKPQDQSQQQAQGQQQQISQGQQLQGVWLKRQQQPQQQTTQVSQSKNVQPQVEIQRQQPQGQPQQQPAQGPQQYQQIPQGQQQMQGARVPWQQPQAQPQQQITQDPRQYQQMPQGQQQMQGARVPWQQPQAQPQQQIAQDPWQYQQMPQGQQQMQGARVPWQQPQAQPQQQITQDPRQYQQMPQGQQQMQGARVPWQQPQAQPQQQITQDPRQYQQMPQGQQQMQGARVAWQQPQAQPQQQITQDPRQYQQMPQGQQQMQGARVAWQQPQGQSQQQVAQDPRQYQQMPQDQQQIQGAKVPWQQPQGQPQQISQSQAQQQQRVSTSTQRQQVPSNVRAAGDRQVQAVGMTSQPSTSTKSLELSGSDPFHSQMIEKTKMSSDQLAYYQNMIPKRVHPDKGGSVGIKIEVLTNMFKVIFDKNFVTNAVHYDVTIKPYKQSTEKNGKKKDQKEFKLPKAVCRSIFEQFRNKHFNNRFPAYDGKKNAFSANDLPFVDDIADVFEHENLNGRKNQYQIILKKVANVDLSCVKDMRPGLGNRNQSAEQVLDIIMRHAPESQFVNIGRSLFWNINEKEPLGGGVALARGGFMSGVLGWKLYLNVDVSHKGFTMKQSVLSYIVEVTRKDRPTYNDVMQNMSKIQSFLRNLKVSYEIPNISTSKRTHRIIKLSEKTSDSVFIQKSDNEEPKETTIKQYFSTSKKYDIKWSDLPTLHVNTKADGSEILLPIELCTIMPGQPIRKLDEEQTSNMIKKAATDAATRRTRIEEAFGKIQVNNSPVMTKEFHLSVSKEMEKVPARILPAPELKYKQEKTQVRKGTWWLKPFFDAKNLEKNSWTIVNLSGQQNIDNFMYECKNMLQETANNLKMMIDQPCMPFKSLSPYDLNSIKKYFNDNKNLKLIIVILPSRTDAMYGNVKKITEMEVGVLTQCMKVQTLRKLKPATVNNILQKINSKLNGVNHTFDKLPSCFQVPCMLVGADVTHPSPDSKDIPSIAAVAASRDRTAFRYNVALRLQQPKEEMILDLKQIILTQLGIFVQELKTCPRRIIYYRDGVSEGQLAQVMYYEVEAIKKAIAEFTHEGKKGNIEVTCLVVQKRHHVRLFPTNPRDEIDTRTKNVQAGTIVDTNITHPDHIDFYLVSHASIQGTARPTKYRCIYNDSKFTEDQLEELTYYLCHIYARCTRSVSYPAPTYYAHLGAFRGRALIQGNEDFRLSDLEREQKKFTLKMGESPMFFV